MIIHINRLSRRDSLIVLGLFSDTGFPAFRHTKPLCLGDLPSYCRTCLKHRRSTFPLISSLPVGSCYAPSCMELSLEAYRNIVKHVDRADIATLCRVSKGFRRSAERALYNTLYMRNAKETISLCETLAKQPRLSALVDALTVSLSKEDGSSDSEDESEGEEDTEPPENYWRSIALALEKTIYLRYLNIHINNGSNTSRAWILNSCTFQLRSFHCDLVWDNHLIAFLNKQVALDDLYILDYNDFNEADTPTTATPTPSAIPLDTQSLPHLSTLECTFTEAAAAIVPTRPITHLKTCFSRSDMGEKRAEMSLLLSKVKQSSRPLRSLDIADSSYTEAFSMELLVAIINTGTRTNDLRYLGTLVLPIAGRERLQFYGLLMRLPRIQCVEVDVSEWVPPPSSPPAFRALASELRLYSPTVKRIVFVHEFDRTVVTVVDGVCRVENDVNTDILWREV